MPFVTTFRLRGQRSFPLRHRRGASRRKKKIIILTNTMIERSSASKINKNCLIHRLFKIIIGRISMYTSIWEYYKYAVFKYNENRKKSQIYIEWNLYTCYHENQFKPIKYVNNVSCDLLFNVPHSQFWKYWNHQLCERKYAST